MPPLAASVSILLLSIIVSNASYAQSICRVYEYAELRDMRQDQLEEMFCQYNKSMYAMISASLAEIKAGHSISSQRAEADSNRCAQELERIERVLDSKFKAKRPQCPAK